MSKHYKEDTSSKDLGYYVTLFKIEGHSTFRAHLHSDAGGFDREWSQGGTRPKITEKRVYRIDRITGEWKIV